MKKNIYFLVICTILFSCNWFREKPAIAIALSKKLKNSLYKQFNLEDYHLVFVKELENTQLYNDKIIKTYFNHESFQSRLVTNFYANHQLDSLLLYLKNSKEDGFNPATFKLEQLKAQFKRLQSNTFKSIDEVYPIVAKLEIIATESLLKYCNYMKFGAVEPRNIYSRYYIDNKNPDSTEMMRVLTTNDVLTELKNAQPKSLIYKGLKKQLAHYRNSLHNEDNSLIKKIILNMERLRWDLPIKTEEMVIVNIPDLSLTWFKANDTLLHMNVCVGAKREDNYAEKIKIYNKTGNLDDMPENHETPQLMSIFDEVQANPVWNIPSSIAKREIYGAARRNPYYLERNNIKVYYKGKVIRRSDTINWNSYSRDKLPFRFKQGAGDDNALGKFKFVFENGSSIYLHDTNNKYAFKLKNRAISHGCIRVEKPLKFAELLVKNKYQYDHLRMDVSLPPIDTTLQAKFVKKMALRTDTNKVFTLKPSWFAARKNIGILLGYYTAWPQNGEVHFSPDIYAYDDILWDALKPYIL